MKKRPVCRITVPALLGLVLCGIGAVRWVIPVFAVLLADAAGRKRSWPRAGRICLGFICFLAGALLFQAARSVSPEEGSLVTVTGKIDQYEYKNNTIIYYVRGNSPYHRVMIKGTDQTYISHPLSPGIKIRAEGIVENFQEPANKGQFHQKLYYKSQNVDFQIKDAVITVTGGRGSIWAEGCKALQGTLADCFYRIADEKTASLLAAMVAGDKTGLDPELRALYQRNGIAHILAISGLHISILGMGVYRLIRKLGCPLLPACLSGAGFTLCFGAMTGMSVSTLRAVTMYTVSMGAQITGRTYDGPSALSLAALLVVLERPFAVFQPSMQYSFGAVGALLALTMGPPLLPSEKAGFEHAKKKRVHDGKTGRAGKLAGIVRKGAAGLAASAAIQLVTMPVQLYHSYSVPVYGVLLNLFVVPTVGVILIMAVLAAVFSLLFGGGLLPLAKLLLLPCRWLFSCYTFLCETAERIPCSRLTPGQPGVVQILLFYGLLFLAAACLYRAKGRLRLMALILPLCGVLLLQCHPFRTLEITMLDVGQGEAICIRTPEGATVLSDSGSTSVGKVGAYRVKPFLLASGVSVVDAVLVSHCDLDHISGIEELLEENGREITIRTLILPDVSGASREQEGSGAGRDEATEQLAAKAALAGVEVQYAKAGDALQVQGGTFTCLAPEEGSLSADRNENSAVYVFSRGKFRLLLTGDLPAEREDPLLGQQELSCQVLKVAHHGSKNSTSEALLQKTSPKTALISCGKNNRYGHPDKELLERLEAAGIRWYCTSEVGAVCLKVGEDGGYEIRLGYDSPFSTLFNMSARTSMAFSSS